MRSETAAPGARPPFSVESVYPVSNPGSVVATLSVRFETLAGPLTVHGWRVVEVADEPHHISVPVERIPTERRDGRIERRYFPIVTYPRHWRPALQAACLEAFNRHSSEGGATCR